MGVSSSACIWFELTSLEDFQPGAEACLQLDWMLCLFGWSLRWRPFVSLSRRLSRRKFVCMWVLVNTFFHCNSSFSFDKGSALSFHPISFTGGMAATIHISIISVDAFGNWLGFLRVRHIKVFCRPPGFCLKDWRAAIRMQSEHGKRWPCSNADVKFRKVLVTFGSLFGSSSHHKILQIQVRLTTYCSSVSRFQEEKDLTLTFLSFEPNRSEAKRIESGCWALWHCTCRSTKFTEMGCE